MSENCPTCKSTDRKWNGSISQLPDGAIARNNCPDKWHNSPMPEQSGKQPWTVETWPAREDDEQNRPRIVIVADGAYLCELEGGLTAEIHDEQMRLARLIAAAPELLSALLDAPIPHGQGWAMKYEMWYQRRCDVLRKATGEGG